MSWTSVITEPKCVLDMNPHIVSAHSLAFTKAAKKLCHFPATMGLDCD